MMYRFPWHERRGFRLFWSDFPWKTAAFWWVAVHLLDLAVIGAAYGILAIALKWAGRLPQ